MGFWVFLYVIAVGAVECGEDGEDGEDATIFFACALLCTKTALMPN
jgi:hypothetical protein